MLLVGVGVLMVSVKGVSRLGKSTRAHITHLTAKPSRMIGVQVGVWRGGLCKFACKSVCGCVFM